MKEAELKDGIHRSLFTSDGAPLDKSKAVAEWKTYLDSFDSIQEVSLNVDKLEEWSSQDSLKAGFASK